MHEHNPGPIGPEQPADGETRVDHPQAGDESGALDAAEEQGSRLALSWKTRTKLVVVLSFVVLVAVQIAGRSREPGSQDKKKAVKASEQHPASPALAIGAGKPATPENGGTRHESPSVEQTALLTDQGESHRSNEPAPRQSSLGGGLVDVTRPSEFGPAPPKHVGERSQQPAVEQPVEIIPSPSRSTTALEEPSESTTYPPLSFPDDGVPDPRTASAPLQSPTSPRTIPADESSLLQQPSIMNSAQGTTIGAATPESGDPRTVRESGQPIATERPVAPDSVTFSQPPEVPLRREPIADQERQPRSLRSTQPNRDTIGSRIEPITHVVRRGENFWTIARHYYGSGRFYRALWKANEQVVPRIDELYIGTPIKIPAPEDLDRSFIDSPRQSVGAPRTGAVDVAPRDTAIARTASEEQGAGMQPSAPSQTPASKSTHAVRPRLREYVTRSGETLRSIAAHELGDAHRDVELERLNVDSVDDPLHIPAGTILRIPAQSRGDD